MKKTNINPVDLYCIALKRYFSVLKDFEKSPDAQADEIRELLKDQEEIIQSIIHSEH